MSNNGIVLWIDRSFDISERGSTIIIEIRSGVITFISMLYILVVTASLLGGASSSPAASHIAMTSSRVDIIVATSITAALSTALSSISSNLPFAIGPSLGLTSYISYGLLRTGTMTWPQALSALVVAGICAFLLSLFRATDFLFRIVPTCIRVATIVGTSLILAIIGLLHSGIIRSDNINGLTFGDINNQTLWLSLGGLALIALAHHHQIKGGVFLSICIISLIHWLIQNEWPATLIASPHISHPLVSMDILSSLTSSTSLPAIIVFICITIFDIISVMVALARMIDMVYEGRTGRGFSYDGGEAWIRGGKWVLAWTTFGSVIGAAMGSGTPFVIQVESAIGISEGARTGLSSLVTSLLLLITVPFAPLLAALSDTCGVAPVLILVATMMIGEARNINWDALDEALPSFLVIILLPCTFSFPISIAIGLIFYIVFYLLTGKFISPNASAHNHHTNHGHGHGNGHHGNNTRKSSGSPGSRSHAGSSGSNSSHGHGNGNTRQTPPLPLSYDHDDESPLYHGSHTHMNNNNNTNNNNTTIHSATNSSHGHNNGGGNGRSLYHASTGTPNNSSNHYHHGNSVMNHGTVSLGVGHGAGVTTAQSLFHQSSHGHTNAVAAAAPSSSLAPTRYGHVHGYGSTHTSTNVDLDA